MTPQDVGQLLDRQEYKFAKSMPWLPHWYTLKSTWDDPALYQHVISWILRNGELRSWGRAPAIRRYFDFNGYRYWPMTTDPAQSILLNRAKIDSDTSRPWSPAPDPYDDVAGSYDDLWGTPEALQEDQELMALLGYESGSVLDIGCGTGLFLDHHPEAQSYFGCDPSQAMLQRLQAKHPAAITYPLTFEQCLPALNGTKYDHIISLFGSPSYVDPRKLAKLDSLLAPGGRVFLMFCSPDYSPITHQHIGNPPTIHNHVFSSYGHVSTFNNYTIVQR